MKMIPYKKICICGGGSLGHVLAAVLNQAGCSVNLLTGKPEKWQKEITIEDPSGKLIQGEICKISNDPKEVIPEAEMIILCVPGYLIHKTILSIQPYLSESAQIGSVVSSTGFFWIARSILGSETQLFGFQRVPFICRISNYGQSAIIKGYKSQLKIAGSRNSQIEKIASFFETSFHTPISILSHYLEATLTNSNPILHPARIYGIIKTQPSFFYTKEIFFYEEWDDLSSEILIGCDSEFQQIIQKLPVNKNEIPSILTYYDSIDTSSLTHKMKTIQAFKGIKLNMLPTENNLFKLDYQNRYFTEDIPFGILIIKSIASVMDIRTPIMDKVIRKIQQRMGKSYLIGNELSGKDIKQTGTIQNYGISTIEELISL